MIHSEGTFERAGGAFSTDEDGVLLFAGVKIDLWAPELTFVVEQGEDLQAIVRVGFGL